MTPAFLDTSGWFAALSPREAQHRTALAAYRKLVGAGTRFVTTNLVVAEMQILISRGRGGAEGLRFIEQLYLDPLHEVIFVDRALERAAVERWLTRFRNQPVSLADAVSFEVMRLRKIPRALSLDEHFALAGYENLP